MKRKRNLNAYTAIAGSSLLAITSANAADGTWSVSAGAATHNWTDSAMWTSGTIADGADFTANFTGINITGDKIVSLNGVNRTIGNITFTDLTTSSHNLLISGDTLTLDRTAGIPIIDVTQAGRTLTISSVVAGNDGLQKNGAGNLNLSGANTFTGGIFLNGGTLSGTAVGLNSNLITVNGSANFALASGASTNSGITLNASSALSLQVNNNAFTVNGAVTGAGNLVVSLLGSGTQTYSLNSTSNTFTGGIDYSTATNGSSTLNVNSFADSATPSAGNIRFGVVAGASANSHSFNLGSGAITGLTLTNRQFDIAGTSNLNVPTINNNSGQVFTINSNLLASGTGTRTFSLGGTGTGLSTFAGTITNGSLTTLGLTKAGTGTWVLTNTSNSYNGITAVTGGTLGFANGVLGSGGTINASGGTLLWLAGNTEDISSRLAMTAATNSTFNTNGNDVTFATAFGSSNTGRLVKTGLGTLTLQGNNTFSGTTTISGGGTLVLDYTTNNGSKIGNAALNLSGGNLVLRGNSAAPQAVTSIVIAANTGNSISRDGSSATIANAGVLTVGANSNLTIAEAGIVSTATLNNASGIQTLGQVTVADHFATRDAGGLLQAYSGYTTVTTAGGGSSAVVNQLSGGGNMAATLSSYSLRIVNDANDNILNLGTNRNLSFANGGTLLYAGGFNDNYTINGDGTSTVRPGSGNQTMNVNVFTGTLTINAILGSNANSAVTKTGVGTLVVGGANSARSGAASTTYVQQGVLRLANDFGLGDATGGTVVQAGAALELSQTTAVTPADITVGAEALSITGTGISNGGALRNHTGSNTYGGLITIGAGGARINANAATSLALTGGIVTSLFNDVTFGGDGNTTVSTAAISGAGGLIKDGDGTLTLSTGLTNTYTGATNVNDGTLIVNGNISSSSLTTVAIGATLGGSGTVGRTVVNGTLSVGNSPGQMDFTNTLALAGGTIMEVDGILGAGVVGGHDFVNLTGVGAAGVLTYGGTMTLDFGSTYTAGSYSWNLFDFASETGTFTGITLADQYSGILLDLDTNGIWDLTSGNNTWVFTESTGVLDLTVVIPEPSTALLGGLGVFALLLRRRR
jgi:fibronectin-binding autotransporter adhesin